MQEMQETCHPLEEIVMVGGCSSENHGTEYVCNLYSRENLEWRVDLGQEYKRYLQGVKDGLLRGRVYMEKVIEARNKSKMHRQQIQEMEKERALLYHDNSRNTSSIRRSCGSSSSNNKASCMDSLSRSGGTVFGRLLR